MASLQLLHDSAAIRTRLDFSVLCHGYVFTSEPGKFLYNSDTGSENGPSIDWSMTKCPCLKYKLVLWVAIPSSWHSTRSPALTFQPLPFFTSPPRLSNPRNVSANLSWPTDISTNRDLNPVFSCVFVSPFEQTFLSSTKTDNTRASAVCQLASSNSGTGFKFAIFVYPHSFQEDWGLSRSLRKLLRCRIFVMDNAFISQYEENRPHFDIRSNQIPNSSWLVINSCPPLTVSSSLKFVNSWRQPNNFELKISGIQPRASNPLAAKVRSSNSPKTHLHSSDPLFARESSKDRQQSFLPILPSTGIK